MFKKKIGRPTNKAIKRRKTIKAIGVFSIIGLFGFVMFNLNNYVNSDNLKASVTKETLKITNKSRAKSNECSKDIYSFSIVSSGGAIKNITYSTNNKNWSKFQSSFANVEYSKNKEQAKITIRKSYNKLYIKVKNKKEEKIFTIDGICRIADAEIVSLTDRKVDDSSCHTLPLKFQIKSNTGIKSIFYSLDDGKNYTELKNSNNDIEIEIDAVYKYANITIKKSYEKFKIKIKDTLGNYKEFGSYKINIQSNCGNNNTVQTGVKDEYVKCSDNQVKEYLISHNVDLSTCEHVIKYNDNTEKKYNISDYSYIEKDPKPVVAKLLAEDNTQKEVTNMKAGTYTLKFYNNETEIRNESKDSKIIVKTPKQGTYSVVTSFEYPTDATDREIALKYFGKGIKIPVREGGKVRIVISKEMLKTIEEIDPESVKSIVSSYGIKYPLSNNEIMKKITFNIAKYDDGEISESYIYTMVKTKKTALNNATISTVKAKNYTGSAITPIPVVKFKGKTLQKDKDYKLEYVNNINVGTATIHIIGIGNYVGGRATTFEIINAKQNQPNNNSTNNNSIKKPTQQNQPKKNTQTQTGPTEVKTIKVTGIAPNNCRSKGVTFTIDSTGDAGASITKIEYSLDGNTWKASNNCNKGSKKASCRITGAYKSIYYKVTTSHNHYQVFGPYCTK